MPNLRQAILEYIRAGEDLLTTPELSEEEQEALEGMVARLYARLQPRKRKSNGNGTERHP